MSYVDVVLADSPYAYWPMQEVGGTVNKDVVGGRSLTWGSVSALGTREVGVLGEGLDRCAVGSTTAYSSATFTWSPTDFSVEFWIKPNAKANYRQVVSGSAGPGGSWSVFEFSGSTTDIYCGAQYVGNATRFTPTETAGLWQAGVWQHYVFTFLASTAEMRLYKNGVLGAGPMTGLAPATAWPGLVVGGSGTTETMDASIQHVALYPSVLSAAQVARHYREARRGGVILGGGYG